MFMQVSEQRCHKCAVGSLRPDYHGPGGATTEMDLQSVGASAHPSSYPSSGGNSNPPALIGRFPSDLRMVISPGLRGLGRRGWAEEWMIPRATGWAGEGGRLLHGHAPGPPSPLPRVVLDRYGSTVSPVGRERGVRTMRSYEFLQEVRIRSGRRVARGERVEEVRGSYIPSDRLSACVDLIRGKAGQGKQPLGGWWGGRPGLDRVRGAGGEAGPVPVPMRCWRGAGSGCPGRGRGALPSVRRCRCACIFLGYGTEKMARVWGGRSPPSGTSLPGPG